MTVTGRKYQWARLAAAGLLAGALCGCGKASKTYPVDPSAAWSALVGTTIPGIAFGERAHGLPADGTQDRVTWAIEAGPDEALQAGVPDAHHIIMKLSATLTAVSGGTEVSVDIQPAGIDDPAKIDALDSQLPAVARLWRAIASEQVDAVLTHRNFDMANIQLAMAEAVVSRLPQIRQQMDDAAKAFQRRDQDRIDRAYALDRQGH